MLNFVFPLSLPGIKINVRRAAVSDTIVQQGASGSELRATQRSRAIYKYSLEPEFLRSAQQPTGAFKELESLLALIGAAQGRFDSFLLADPEDRVVVDMGFAIGDGTTTAFQLQRTQGAGALRYSLVDQAGTAQVTTPRTNLLPYSQRFDSWNNQNSPLIVANAAVAPDGTLTADYVRGTGVGGANVVETATTVRGRTYTFSVWLKADPTNSHAYLGLYDLTGGADISFVSAAIVSGPGVATLSGGPSNYVARVNGLSQTQWTRLSGTFIAPGISTACYVYPDYAAGSYTGSYLWEGQLELGAVATANITTPAGVAVTANPNYWPAGGDGFDPVYDPAGVDLAVSLASASGSRVLRRAALSLVNILSYSTTPSNAAWFTNGGNITFASGQVDPLGGTTAWKLTNNTGGQCYLGQEWQSVSGALVPPGLTPAVGAEQLFTYSLWLRAGTVDSADVGFYSVQPSGGIFPLQSAVILSGPGTVAATTPSGTTGYVHVDGLSPVVWTQIQVTLAGAPNVNPSNYLRAYLFLNDYSVGLAVNDSLYFWHPQVEPGPVFTSDNPVATTPAWTTFAAEYSLGATGVVTLVTAAPAAAWLTWSGSYYRRVRFDDDAIEFERFGVGYWLQKGLPLVSVLS